MVIEKFHVLKCKFLSFLHNNIHIEGMEALYICRYGQNDKLDHLTLPCIAKYLGAS